MKSTDPGSSKTFQPFGPRHPRKSVSFFGGNPKYLLVAERKRDKREIGKDPTEELENLKLDSVRI